RLDIQQTITKSMKLRLAASRAQPGLSSIRVSDQSKFVSQLQRDSRAHQRRFHSEIQHPSRLLLRSCAFGVRRLLKSKRGNPRLVHDEIHFLLLFPLEKPRHGSSPSCCGLPGYLRVGIAGLIFPQALELAPVSSPWRLLRRNKHPVNWTTQNLLSSGSQI